MICMPMCVIQNWVHKHGATYSNIYLRTCFAYSQLEMEYIGDTMSIQSFIQELLVYIFNSKWDTQAVYSLFKSLLKDHVPHALNLEWNTQRIPCLCKVLFRKCLSMYLIQSGIHRQWVTYLSIYLRNMFFIQSV